MFGVLVCHPSIPKRITTCHPSYSQLLLISTLLISSHFISSEQVEWEKGVGREGEENEGFLRGWTSSQVGMRPPHHNTLRGKTHLHRKLLWSSLIFSRRLKMKGKKRAHPHKQRCGNSEEPWRTFCFPVSFCSFFFCSSMLPVCLTFTCQTGSTGEVIILYLHWKTSWSWHTCHLTRTLWHLHHCHARSQTRT